MSGADAQKPHVHILLRDRLFASDRDELVYHGRKVVKGHKVLHWPSMLPTKDQPGSTAIFRAEWQTIVNLIAERDGLEYRMNLTGRAKRRAAESGGAPPKRPGIYDQMRAAFRKRRDETKTSIEKTEARLFEGKYSRLSLDEKLAKYSEKVEARRAKDAAFFEWWELRTQWTSEERRAEARGSAREKRERTVTAAARPVSRSRRPQRDYSARSKSQPGF